MGKKGTFLSHRLILAGLLCSALTLAACGPAASKDEPTASAAEALYANASTLWANAGNGRVDVNMCWENPENAPGSTSAEKAAWRDERRQAVEEAWARMGRVNFYGWDGNDPIDNPTHCVSGAPGIHIVICNLPSDPRCPAVAWGSQMEPGGYPVDNGLDNGLRLRPDHGPFAIVHEVGHGLGFYHEEERRDAPQIAEGPCKKQEWFNSNPALYGAYDPTSIMSYCQTPMTAPWLSPNDVASFQRFYLRRKPNSLVSPRGNCAAAHYAHGNGDPFFMWDCDEANRDQELVDSPNALDATGRDLQMYGTNLFSTPLCAIPESVNSGAIVRLGACSSSSSWLFQSMYLRGFGGLCLDLQNGATAPGTPIQMRKCGESSGASQRWTLTRTGLIRYLTSNWCAKLVNGQLQLAICNTADNAQVFSFDAGQIRRVSNDKCLDVQGPSDAQFTDGQGMPTVGTYVQELACNSSLNQAWNLDGPVRHAASSNLCLNRAGADGNGTSVTLATCDGSTNQEWDYYF